MIARILVIIAVSAMICPAGPYKEPGIYGFVDSFGQPAGPTDSGARINPIFRGWATRVASYQPCAQTIKPTCKDPNKALGPVTGNSDDVVSLGDLTSAQLIQHLPAGRITVSFTQPIRNGKGYDFAVFENGLICQVNSGNGSIAGQLFAELGYVEVSTDGQNFVRFPSVSLTPAAVGMLGTIDPENVYNLAGRHPNAYTISIGTPFDLSDLKNYSIVISGIVDLNNINYVRIVDIPGRGDYTDEATAFVNPGSWPNWNYFTQNHPVYDAWYTFDSGGFDLEAIGVLHEQRYAADINKDGRVDFRDFAMFAASWQSHFGQQEYLARCDLAEPKNYVIDWADLAKFSGDWLGVESWCGQ